MAFKFVVFAAFVAAAQAGVIAPLSYAAPVAKYSDATAVSYSSLSSPDVHSYAAPVAKVAYSAPVSYAAPVAKVAYSAPVSYSAPVAKVAYAPVAKAIYAEPEAPAQYDFAYSVSDPHTGDVKEQHETREGDVVHGSYSLIEADGTKRIVEYTADEHNGFNAVVRNEGQKIAAPVAKVVAPVAHAYAAPAVAHYSAPVVAKVAAPYAHQGYSAPSYYH